MVLESKLHRLANSFWLKQSDSLNTFNVLMSNEKKSVALTVRVAGGTFRTFISFREVLRVGGYLLFSMFIIVLQLIPANSANLNLEIFASLRSFFNLSPMGRYMSVTLSGGRLFKAALIVSVID